MILKPVRQLSAGALVRPVRLSALEVVKLCQTRRLEDQARSPPTGLGLRIHKIKRPASVLLIDKPDRPPSRHSSRRHYSELHLVVVKQRLD